MDVKKITSLIIEPTNTCNLRCTFCFVTDGMTRDGGFMDFDLFKKIIDDCTDLEHLCMHNWGEPLLHKDIFRMIEYAKKLSADRIELFTGQYAKLFIKDRENAIKPYIECSKLAKEINIGVNAGHDLNQENLKYFNNSLNNLLEVSIGHALICESIYQRIKKTIKSYLDILNNENSSF